MRKSEKSHAGWYFLLTVAVLYLITGFLKMDAVLPSLKFSLRIIKNIIPIFVVIFALMVALEYFVSPENVRKYLGKSAGLKRWLIAVAGGIISTGPIYMWYPMLRQLRKKGVKYGFIATFLYNRAVKPPLIPMIILYFGLRYTVVLTIVMIIISIVQGIIFEKIEGGGLL